MLREIKDLALEKKAEDLKIIDIREVSNIADYFILCSGGSNRQAITIAENILDRLSDKKVKPMGVEGVKEGRWIVMDYADIIIHVFYHPVREFYEFDDLWSVGVELKVS